MITAKYPSLRLTIRVHDQAFRRSTQLALDSPNEIGGILVGWWESGTTAVVRDFLVVTDLHSGTHHYERGHKEAQKLLTELLNELQDPKIGYIGEWHSHPAPQPPSSADRKAIADITRENKDPVALVVLAATPDRNIIPFGLVSRTRWPRRIFLEDATIERITHG